MNNREINQHVIQAYNLAQILDAMMRDICGCGNVPDTFRLTKSQCLMLESTCKTISSYVDYATKMAMDGTPIYGHMAPIVTHDECMTLVGLCKDYDETRDNDKLVMAAELAADMAVELDIAFDGNIDGFIGADGKYYGVYGD